MGGDCAEFLNEGMSVVGVLRLKQRSAEVWRFVRHTGWLPFILLTAACLLIEEEYPFSNFPMYSSFSRETDYVFLATGEDKPLPSAETIAVSTSTLKKMFKSELRIARRQGGKSVSLDESKRIAAERLLARFRAADRAGTIGDLPAVVRLYEVEIRLADSRITRETTLVAESR